MLVAIAGLVFGVAAMDNVLPLGTTGSLLSGGTVPVLSVAVGVEVTGGGDADPQRAPRPDAAAGAGVSVLAYVVAVWLLVIGLYGVITSRHLVHLVLCLGVMQASTYVLLLAVG